MKEEYVLDSGSNNGYRRKLSKQLRPSFPRLVHLASLLKMIGGAADKFKIGNTLDIPQPFFNEINIQPKCYYLFFIALSGCVGCFCNTHLAPTTQVSMWTVTRYVLWLLNGTEGTICHFFVTCCDVAILLSFELQD